jgi:hypothetical protein
MSATTTQLLSSGGFADCVMTLYLFKVHRQTFLSIPVTKKCEILSCDAIVASERNRGEERGGYRILVGNPEAKISLVRPRRSWKADIKMDLIVIE